MTLGRLFADGQEVIVNKKIGKGGEGEVFSLTNLPGYAVKAYLPHLVKEREGKIRAMVDSKLAATSATIAFPYQVVTNAKGEFIGFTMRLVDNHKEIHELQTPSSRLKYFPNADYRFLVRTAVNISRVFAQVHAAGCIVGDINQRGILVSPTATVALIDADSFQVMQGANRYLCVVGVAEYTPPELQGRKLGSIVRTTNHDAFGLAVSLFQLLCMDRHPFSGRFSGNGDMPLEKAIAEFRFAYSGRDTGMRPPPGTVRLRDLTPAIAALFEQAFSREHVGRRPTPTQWIAALEELQASLRVCSHNRLHHYSRLAPECPWCRMEAEYGRPLFHSTEIFAVHLPKGRVDDKLGLILDIQALLAAVNSIAIPQTISVPVPATSYVAQPSPAAVEAKRKQQASPVLKAVGMVVIVAAGVMMFGYQLPLLVAGGIAGFGGWLIVRDADPSMTVLQNHKTLVSAIAKRVQELQSSSLIDRVLRKKAEALDAIDEYKSLSETYGKIVSDYNERRRQHQLDSHLSSHSIRGARIAKLSSADVAALASYGIANASDSKRRDVQQAYGIGPVKAANIAAWVRRVEAGFNFRQEYTADDRNKIQQAQSEIISKQQGVDDRFKRTIMELRNEAHAFEQWKSKVDPDLARLANQLGQAEADIRHLGLPVPLPIAIAPFQVPSVEGLRNRRAQPSNFSARPVAAPVSGSSKPTNLVGQSCPKCGSYMLIRTARQGRNSGNQFWGCSNYPRCTGTRPK